GIARMPPTSVEGSDFPDFPIAPNLGGSHLPRSEAREWRRLQNYRPVITDRQATASPGVFRPYRGGNVRTPAADDGSSLCHHYSAGLAVSVDNSVFKPAP